MKLFSLVGWGNDRYSLNLPCSFHVLFRRGVGPHPSVHAWTHKHRSLPEVPGHADARNEVVAGAVHDLLHTQLKTVK